MRSGHGTTGFAILSHPGEAVRALRLLAIARRGLAASIRSLITQRFNRVEAGGLTGWKIAKDHAHRGREEKGEENGR